MNFLSINKSLKDFGVINHKELWDVAQKQGYKGLTISVKTELVKSADGNKFHAIFSTANEDRHGDIVFQNWDLKFFKKNPVYLDSHNYGSIEHILGRVDKISSKDNILEGDVVFALENPKGLLAFKLAEGGFLNTSSVGFIPKEFDKNGNILKSELLEISAVAVPANADALFEKKGIDNVIPGVGKLVDAHAVNTHAVIASMAAKEIKMLNILSRAVAELTNDNKQSQRRVIFKALRNLQGQIVG